MKHELKAPPDSSWFIDQMNRGGLMYPNEIFVKEVILWNEIFVQCHPPNGIHKTQNVTKNFAKLLKKRFPYRDEKLLALFARTRTRIRIRRINQFVKKRGKGTLRGKTKLAQISHWV